MLIALARIGKFVKIGIKRLTGGKDGVLIVNQPSSRIIYVLKIYIVLNYGHGGQSFDRLLSEL